MTIDEAINQFEALLNRAEKQIKSFEQCWRGWKSNFRKGKELYEIALAALRAQKNNM